MMPAATSRKQARLFPHTTRHVRRMSIATSTLPTKCMMAPQDSKRQAAREVIDVLEEIAVLLVSLAQK